jgi:hypothetical protein
MAEFKTDCKVAGYPGLAHIVEQAYDKGFKVWYGCVNILCEGQNIQAVSEFGGRFLNRLLQMEIEDGRTMTIHIGKCRSELVNLSLGGQAPTAYLGCYFVSLTPLINVMEMLDDPDRSCRNYNARIEPCRSQSTFPARRITSATPGNEGAPCFRPAPHPMVARL